MGNGFGFAWPQLLVGSPGGVAYSTSKALVESASRKRLPPMLRLRGETPLTLFAERIQPSAFWLRSRSEQIQPPVGVQRPRRQAPPPHPLLSSAHRPDAISRKQKVHSENPCLHPEASPPCPQSQAAR